MRRLPATIAAALCCIAAASFGPAAAAPCDDAREIMGENGPCVGAVLAEALPPQASADSVAGFTFTAPRRQLVSLSVKLGATAGYVMVLDAAALPADGPVAPVWCSPQINAGAGVALEWARPLQLTNGVTVAFSTTGCDNLTASATAKFMGQVR